MERGSHYKEGSYRRDGKWTLLSRRGVIEYFAARGNPSSCVVYAPAGHQPCHQPQIDREGYLVSIAAHVLSWCRLLRDSMPSATDHSSPWPPLAGKGVPSFSCVVYARAGHHAISHRSYVERRMKLKPFWQ